MKFPILSWPPSTTTVSGVAILVGSVAAILMHQMTWPQAIPLFAAGVTAIVVPDNANAMAAVKKLAADAEVVGSVTAKVPALVNDAVAVEQAVTDATKKTEKST